jgi:hypothetical protein
MYTVSPGQKPSDLMPVLKATLAHEFDHLLAGKSPWLAPSDTHLEYLIRPDEIGSTITQAYKEAKARKEPMSKTLDRIVTHALEQDIEESDVAPRQLRSMAKKVMDELKRSAKERFPTAIFESSSSSSHSDDRIYYRIQPKGMSIDHRSETSSGNTAKGLHVFLTAGETLNIDGPGQFYGDEVLIIRQPDGDYDNQDVEGVEIPVRGASVMRRFSWSEWEKFLKKATGKPLKAIDAMDEDTILDALKQIK